ncbi:hypothetical protein GCM10018771_35270 [Streptomyces cellulosae]|nr:hypothetical protein GCM10018771_35270 [Streptomyces cellulosae]
MNHEVPQPTTATRSPRLGRAPVWRGRDVAAWRHTAGWEAISAEVRDELMAVKAMCSFRNGGGGVTARPAGHFTEPAVSPDTTWRSMKAKSTTTGTIAITDAANR